MTQLAPNRFKTADSQRNIFHVVPEAGTPFEALLTDKYFAHVSAFLKPGSRIEVIAEDGKYWADLLVRDAGKLYAKITVLNHVELEPVEVREGGLSAEGMEVRWCGPKLKWCVLRGKDRLKDEMDKGQAIQWMQSHAKAA